MKNVSDQLVEILKLAGVKRVYSITGDSLNPVNDAIRRDGTIEWIHVRHEEVAAYAASMDAELNGIGCCMGSSGPGHVHLINGLYDANRAGNPVIAIASTIPTNRFGQDYFQETNPFSLFNDCSKYVYVANTPAQFAHMIQAAIQTAITKRGVAVVGLPGDVASADAVEIDSSMKIYPGQSRLIPSEAELTALADLLNKSDKVTLYAGHGCRYAVEEVERLAEVLKAPIAYTFRGKIFFDTDESRFAVGLNGLLGHKSGYDAMNKAEILVMLGTDFPYIEFLPKDSAIIQIDDKPNRLGRRARVDLGIAGDVKDTINVLLPMLTSKTNEDFLNDCRKEFEKSEARLDDFADLKGEYNQIQPEHVACAINELAEKDAVFTVDTGMTSVWAARFIRGGKGRYLTGSFNHGSMANAMPMAIGAAASQKGRQVVALCGDGGISMLMGDLATIAQYKWPIKLIVFNNRSLGMVKLEMQVAGYLDWQTDMVNPPFHEVANVMGIKGWAVHTPEELVPAIEASFLHDGPTLVNIFTNPDALAMPPHIEFDQMKGFLAYMVKLIGKGKWGELNNTVKSNIGHLKELF